MRIVLTFLALIVLGCEFPLEEENFVEISPVPQNIITVDLKNIPDTLAVLESMSVKYSLDLAGSPPVAIFISIDDREPQYLGYSYTGSFYLSNDLKFGSDFGTKGYVPFEFLVLSTSGTGSLADVSLRELIIFSEKRTLYFDYSNVKAIDIAEAKAENGSVYLSWEKYPHLNLRSLKLRRSTYFGGSSTPVSEIFLLDKNATSFQDNSFIGPEVEYELMTENNLGWGAIGLKSRIVSGLNKILEFKTVGVNQLQIKWNRIPLYNNSNGYQIISNGQTLFSTANSSDTTATLSNFPLGSDIVVTLRTVSKNTNYSISSNSSVWLGKKIISPKSIIPDPNHDRFFFLNSPYIIKAEADVRDSVYYNFNNYGPTNLSLAGDKLCVSSGTEILEISTADLSLLNTYPISTTSVFSFLPYKDNIIATSQFGYSYSHMTVFDKASGAVVQNYGFSSSKLISRLWPSHDPEYIVGEGDQVCVFKVNNDGTILSDNCVPGDRAMLSKDKNHLYVFDQYTRRKYKFPSLEIVSGNDISVPNYYSLSFDRVNGVAGIVNGLKYDIFDIETFNLVKRITLANYLSSSNVILNNGVLFVYEGDNVTYVHDINL